MQYARRIGKAIMRTWKMAGVIAVLAGCSVTLFGQAAAEGALSHALSSAAGSTAGRTLGGAANRLAGRVGQRVSSAVSNRQFSTMKNVPRTATSAQANPSASPFGTSLIVSIQGGEATDSSCASSGNTTQMTPAGEPENPNAKVRERCSITNGTSADDHPSVINLPPTQ